MYTTQHATLRYFFSAVPFPLFTSILSLRMHSTFQQDKAIQASIPRLKEEPRALCLLQSTKTGEYFFNPPSWAPLWFQQLTRHFSYFIVFQSLTTSTSLNTFNSFRSKPKFHLFIGLKEGPKAIDSIPVADTPQCLLKFVLPGSCILDCHSRVTANTTKTQKSESPTADEYTGYLHVLKLLNLLMCTEV